MDQVPDGVYNHKTMKQIEVQILSHIERQAVVEKNDQK